MAPRPSTLSAEERVRIGATIRRTRERRGMSAAVLARKAGLSDKAIWNIEVAKSGISIGALFDLARALNCTWTDLLGPAPSEDTDDAAWRSGYRAGVGDAAGAVRALNEGGP